MSLTSVLDLEAKCSMCGSVVSLNCTSLVPFVMWLPFLTVFLCLISSFLPSLSFLAVPDRMALSLSLCLRLTVTPIPLKEGQGLANRWRACSVLLLWLSYPVVCRVPLPFAHCWVRGFWWRLVSLHQGCLALLFPHPFHTGMNSCVNVTDHLLLFYFTVLIN